jgi:predicted metalloprotease with PDZ domain
VLTQPIPAFDYGFDLDATRKAKAIVGVRADSPAYAAGLRDGMTYVKREAGAPGDSRRPLSLRVRDHGTERVITYAPAGAARITFQEVVAPPDLPPARAAACVAQAAGGGPIPGAAASR